MIVHSFIYGYILVQSTQLLFYSDVILYLYQWWYHRWNSLIDRQEITRLKQHRTLRILIVLSIYVVRLSCFLVVVVQKFDCSSISSFRRLDARTKLRLAEQRSAPISVSNTAKTNIFQIWNRIVIIRIRKYFITNPESFTIQLPRIDYFVYLL